MYCLDFYFRHVQCEDDDDDDDNYYQERDESDYVD